MTDASPTTLPAWKQLSKLATARVERPLTPAALSVDVAGLHIDFSRQAIEPDVLEALVDLADQSHLNQAVIDLFGGTDVNTSESRPALHTALRAHPDNQPPGVKEAIAAAANRQREIVQALRSGQWRGHTGKPIRTVVTVGIGGSHLGSELVLRALGPATLTTSGPSTTGPQAGSPLTCRFLANIDSHGVDHLLDGLNPETTLFIIASKSFSTLETKINAETLRAWFLERMLDVAAIERHFLAVTANLDAARAFDIPASNVLPLWDWVGGRYSLWSTIGLPIALGLGNDAFDALLDGARRMDEHFQTAPAQVNAPMLAALIGIWNTNFLGAQSLAVLCYDQRLAGLVTYLQQLEMESNGKVTRRDGERTEVHTTPVLWGGEETNGQHAFHQWLHQGSRAYSADFIATIAPPVEANPSLVNQHQWLLANCLAQGEAMAVGHDQGPAHERVAGGHPSTTILLDELDPGSLGALLALYEHKVYCQGMIWDINPFDQWGVELGKRLGDTVYAGLGGTDGSGEGGSSSKRAKTPTTRDTATRTLIHRIRANRSTEQP